MSVSKRQYHAVDLMKFICALMVIVVHTYPFYEAVPDLGFLASNILGRIIIPFFFISAGYFLFIGVHQKDEGYFRKYIFRLIKLYLIWSVLYIPFGIHRIQTMMTLSGPLWIGALAVAIFNIGTYFHLWYMSALIFAMIFCHYYLKKFSMKSLLILGSVLFLFGLLETYHGLIQNELLLKSVNIYFTLFFTTRNGLFFGILFVALGMAASKYNWIDRVKKPLLLSALFFGLLVIEGFTVRGFKLALDYNMYFMAVPFTVFWFIFLMRSKLNWKLDYKALREYSTIIYFSHGIFLEGVPMILEVIGKTQYFDLGWLRFVSVFFPTLLISWIIRKFIPQLR